MDEIRQAIESEEFAKARRLWSAYADQLQAAIVDGTATQKMMTETGGLLAWSRMAIHSFRTHSADQLRRSHVGKVYGCDGY